MEIRREGRREGNKDKEKGKRKKLGIKEIKRSTKKVRKKAHPLLYMFLISSFQNKSTDGISSVSVVQLQVFLNMSSVSALGHLYNMNSLQIHSSKLGTKKRRKNTHSHTHTHSAGGV